MTWKAILPVLALIVLAAGCSPSVVFLGDPALRVAVGDVERFESRVESAGRTVDERVAIEWDPSPELGTTWLEAELSRTDIPTVILSPYFSLFASDFAEASPETRFIAFGEGATGPANLTRVLFDTVPAMEEAARLIAEWESGGDRRRVAVIHLVNSETARDELDALVNAFDAIGARKLPVTQYTAVPTREEVRQELRNLLNQGYTGFLVRIGAANRHAIDLLQTEPVVFATDAASGTRALDDSLLFSIEHPLEEGVEAALMALRLGDAEPVTVAAGIVPGRALAEPQLEPDIDVGDDS